MSGIQDIMPKIVELVDDRIEDFEDEYSLRPSKDGWMMIASIGKRIKASIPYGTDANSIENDTSLVINSDISGHVIDLSEASEIVENLSESLGCLYNIIQEFAYVCNNLDMLLDEEDVEL